MIRLGILGLGPEWETVYEPTLARLRHRVRVSCVFDPVHARSLAVAQKHRGVALTGVQAMLRYAAVDAILLLDNSWMRSLPVRWCVEAARPLFVADYAHWQPELLRTLGASAAQTGQPLVPEMASRYTPSTSRLHELMATQLGRAVRVAVDCRTSQPGDQQVDGTASTDGPEARKGSEPEPVLPRGRRADSIPALVDWCSYVLRSRPTRVRTELLDSESTASPGAVIRVEFASRGRQAPATHAEIHLPAVSAPGSSLAAHPSFPHRRCEVICERGRAVLEDEAHLSWTRGASQTHEVLTNERSAIEVALDLFLRRVVGGLVPVPSFEDVCRSQSVVRAADLSARCGKAVSLNGRVFDSR